MLTERVGFGAEAATRRAAKAGCYKTAA